MTNGDAFLSCRALIEFLDDYLDARLEPAERARFDEHLAVCPACVRYVKSYRGTLQALTLVGREDGALPEEVPPQLVEAILAARRAAG
jgi:anti-sigma factor RsiW